jgi:hypothetical protein
MNTPYEGLSLNVASWDIKTIERKRGRMKFQLKLNKEETQGFKEFSDHLKPADMGQEEWIRAIFYKGLEKIQTELMEGVEKYMEEHKDELDASGMQEAVDSSGSVETIE